MSKKTAQVILTGYDKPKMDKSVKKILKYSKKIGLSVIKDGLKIKPKSKLWGCEKNNVKEETIFLSGTIDDLEKILHVKIKDGIYLQLLLR